jgi:hypothetical protein
MTYVWVMLGIVVILGIVLFTRRPPAGAVCPQCGKLNHSPKHPPFCNYSCFDECMKGLTETCMNCRRTYIIEEGDTPFCSNQCYRAYKYGED